MGPTRHLYLASKNRHKLQELATMLTASPTRWQVRLAADLAPDLGWVESGTTFYANALIKAQAVRARLTEPGCVLADDSGLCVDALGGAPGVYSSRYAGAEGNDAANNAKLLAALTGVRDRAARFVCCLVFIDEAGHVQHFEGEVKGEIATTPSGRAGFGYDPLFIMREGEDAVFGRTMAELSEAAKNAVSHRRRAFDCWRKALARGFA